MAYQLAEFTLAVVCVCDEVRQEFSELLLRKPTNSLEEYSGIAICGFNKKSVEVKNGIPKCHRNVPDR